MMRAVTIAGVLAAGLVLGGCSQEASVGADADGAVDITVSDPWVRASDQEITAVFGKVHNDTDSDVTLIGAATDLSDTTELHETAGDGDRAHMRPVHELPIRAGGTLVLEPGGNHIMVLEMKKPVEAGDDVAVTLSTESGESIRFHATAKMASAGHEPYESSDDSMDSSDSHSGDVGGSEDAEDDEDAGHTDDGDSSDGDHGQDDQDQRDNG